MNRSPALPVGIVGAGLMGRWHAHAARHAGACVVAVADLDAGAARRLAHTCRGAKSFSDLESMIEGVQPRVIHVCTPPATHAELVERAIQAGRHLVVEKPLTPRVADTERLLQQAADRRVMICPVHQFIFQDGVLRARERLARIGRIVHLEARFCSAGPIDQADDILPHPLSLMHLFLPGGLKDANWTTTRPAAGELRAMCDMDGVTLAIFISMHARPTEATFLIEGTDGTFHLDLFHGYSYLQPGKVSRFKKIASPFERATRSFSAASINLGRRALHGETAYPGLRRLVSCFYRAVQQQLSPPISPADVIAIARARDRLIQ